MRPAFLQMVEQNEWTHFAGLAEDGYGSIR